MRKAIVHVNRHQIARNAKDGGGRPVLTVKRGKKTSYGSQVDIYDAAGNLVARLVYRPQAPLPCGATVWLECEHDVGVEGEVSYADACAT